MTIAAALRSLLDAVARATEEGCISYLDASADGGAWFHGSVAAAEAALAPGPVAPPTLCVACRDPRCPGDCPGSAYAAAMGLDLAAMERLGLARLATARTDGERQEIVRTLLRGAQARAWLDGEDVISRALAETGIRAREDIQDAHALLSASAEAPTCEDTHAHHAAVTALGECPACREMLAYLRREGGLPAETGPDR